MKSYFYTYYIYEDNLPATYLIFYLIEIIIQGRPRRAKTRAPSRPVTDQSQDIDEGITHCIFTEKI